MLVILKAILEGVSDVDRIKDTIKILNDGRYLMAAMPDGTIIPMQLTCILKNDLSDDGFVFCEVTLSTWIKSEDFQITNVSEFEKVKKPYEEGSYKWAIDLIDEKREELKSIKSKWWFKLFKNF